MHRNLQLGPGMSMPVDLITQKTSILARTGAGKTNAGVVICEELLDRKQQIVVLDPKGDWYGLRASADGEGEGYAVIVMGGLHGDVPLESTGGRIVADFVVDTRASVVLDISEFSKGELYRFVTEFCDAFYRRQAKDPAPVLLVLEEADEVVPQFVSAKTAAMVGAVEKVAKRGRFIGIGFLALTQRSASFNKDVLTQTEVLVAMQTTAPQDMKAIDEWIKHHPDQAKREQLLANIQSLKVGEAYVWSPSWLQTFQKFRFRLRRTFDAGKTPKVGERRIEPKKLAPVDLAALQKRMAATVEKAKQEDPRELRKQILDLKAQLAAAQRQKPAPTKERRVEVPVIPSGQVKSLEAAATKLEAVAQKAVEGAKEIRATLVANLRAHGQAVPIRPAPAIVSAPAPPRAVPRPSTDGDVEVKSGARRMLQCLAQRFPLKLTRSQLGTLAGFTPSGGTFSTYFGVLKRLGYLTEAANGDVEITQSGIEFLGADIPPAPSTTQELLAMWRTNLKAGAAEMLDALVQAHPDDMTRDELGQKTGFTATGGTFSTYLGILHRNGLIDKDGDNVRASDTLFITGRPNQ